MNIEQQIKQESERSYEEIEVTAMRRALEDAFASGSAYTLSLMQPKLKTVWEEVDCNQSFPTEDGFYYVMFESGTKGNEWFQYGEWLSRRMNPNNPRVTHWLRPITIIGDAVEFVRWILHEGHEPDGKDWVIKYNDERSTTEDLYQLFKQSK